MIRRVNAARFDALAEGGRNQPLRIAAESEDGEDLDVFLKPSGRPEMGVEGMANELLAACVGGHLGLPVCEPVLVDMSPAWINSIVQPTLRELLNGSCRIAFGSVSAGPGWRKWAPEDRLIGDRRAPALGIFAFDVFTENRDRKVENPNLLVRADQFRIIDHELSFRIRQCLFPRPEPWRPGYLVPHVASDGHVFGALLKGDRHTDVASLRAPWTSLSDDALAAYGAALPPEWAAAAGPIADALAHLKAVRDMIDECLEEVERALA